MGIRKRRGSSGSCYYS